MTEADIRARLASGMVSDGPPGVVVGARTLQGDRVVVPLGRRSIRDPAPMTADTIFWIASMTKLVTAVAALQLVEEGRLSLDAPASDIVPALARSPILSFDSAGAAILRPAERAVTLRHLLTHTAGFGYGFLDPTLAKYAALTGTFPSDILPRLFEAGERWLYGVSLDVVGQMVEAASGQSLEAYFADRVFDPLGMSDTGFVLSPTQGARTATLHARDADGVLAHADFVPRPPPNPSLGGYGLYSTAGDFLALLEALLAGGLGAHGRILSDASLALLTTDQTPLLECGDLENALPSFSNAFAPLPGQSKGWTFGGLYSREPNPGGRRAGAVAWAGISNCYFWFDPAARVAGVALMQLLPFADPAATALVDDFERAVYA